MHQRFIRIRELATTPPRGDKPGRAGRLPVSASTLWRWVARGEFPEPIQLGPGTTAWPIEVIEAWEKSRSSGVAA